MKHSSHFQQIAFVLLTLFIFIGCSFFDATEEPKLKNIYEVLKLECKERNKMNDYDYLAKGMNQHMLSCCLESVEKMQRYGYKEATENEKNKPICKEKGTHLMQLRCPGTLAWCEKNR